MADREVEDFPAPPDELVQPGEEAGLAVSPTEVEPGATLTVSGTGFGFCRVSWSVAIHGTDVSSGPDGGGDAEERSTTLRLPDDIEPGSYEVVARCDSGAGPRDAARATFVVRGPEEETTTTTEPDDEGAASSTTTSSTTTSTTAPPPPTTEPVADGGAETESATATTVG
jgi:hypothetical protein